MCLAATGQLSSRSCCVTVSGRCGSSVTSSMIAAARERAAEDDRCAQIAQRPVRDPVAQRRPQRLREGDDPVEQLRLAGMDLGRRNPAERRAVLAASAFVALQGIAAQVRSRIGLESIMECVIAVALLAVDDTQG